MAPNTFRIPLDHYIAKLKKDSKLNVKYLVVFFIGIIVPYIITCQYYSLHNKDGVFSTKVIVVLISFLIMAQLIYSGIKESRSRLHLINNESIPTLIPAVLNSNFHISLPVTLV
jgi:uncharacterized protein YacL